MNGRWQCTWRKKHTFLPILWHLALVPANDPHSIPTGNHHGLTVWGFNDIEGCLQRDEVLLSLNLCCGVFVVACQRCPSIVLGLHIQCVITY